MSLNSETENKILKAAKEVFLQKGRDGARMQEIAERAGLNKALLHYYFRSKEKLYQTVLQLTLRRFIEGFMFAGEQEESFDQFLRRFINDYIDQLVEHEHVVRFILWELQGGGQQIVEIMRAIFREHGYSQPPVLDRVRQAVAGGHIRQTDPMQFFMNLIGMCVYPFLAEPLLEGVFEIEIRTPAFLTARKSEIFELIWRGIQS